jgi:hypothetical protein
MHLLFVNVSHQSNRALAALTAHLGGKRAVCQLFLLLIRTGAAQRLLP